MRHLKKFENFDFQKEEEELVVPADVVNNEEDELCPACNCKPCECEDEEDENEEDAGAYEDDLRLEKFSAFNEKKATPAQLAARKAFADRIKGKKSDKEDDKKDDKKSEKEDKKDDKKSTLKNPKAADLNKDGKISKYEEKRGKAIQNAIEKKKEEKKK